MPLPGARRKSGRVGAAAFGTPAFASAAAQAASLARALEVKKYGLSTDPAAPAAAAAGGKTARGPAVSASIGALEPVTEPTL